jgi:hypothetical protein
MAAPIGAAARLEPLLDALVESPPLGHWFALLSFGRALLVERVFAVRLGLLGSSRLETRRINGVNDGIDKAMPDRNPTAPPLSVGGDVLVDPVLTCPITLSKCVLTWPSLFDENHVISITYTVLPFCLGIRKRRGEGGVIHDRGSQRRNQLQECRRAFATAAFSGASLWRTRTVASARSVDSGRH